MKHWLTKVAIFSFIMTVGGCGGWVGSRIATKAYPLSMVERVNLTPEVRPGDPVVLAQHVDRKDQCDIVVKRVIRTSSGQRFPVRQAFEEDFGPLGGDKYLLPVPTPSEATLGDATMYSKAYSWCSWFDYIKPSEAESWTLHFKFASATATNPTPESFSSIGVKQPSARPARASQRTPEITEPEPGHAP